MPPDTRGDLGTILGVWAHPDDEAYLSAGLMALAVDAGRRVVCVTATAGEAGFPDHDTRPHEARIAVRRAEMAASLAEIGVREHHWLGYRDGECAAVSDVEAVATICDIIANAQPDTLLTFGPAGMTGHSDHVAVCRWSTLACAQLSPPPRLLYATKSPEWTHQFFGQADTSQIMMVDGMVPEAVPTDDMAVWFDCDGDLLDRKLRALRAQHSQIEPLISSFGLDWFRYFVRHECFRQPRPSDPVW
ncbi:MAG: PIG-L family deacetylase [Actinobacteria bacterium]|nr:PIG-L family deacetylase [Actinomycetota bacterium]